jgi:hypothetical protein
MSTFKEKVEDIVGVTVSDTTALSDYLTASAREVSDILPDEVLIYNSTLLESASTVEISNTKVFAVSRNGRSTVEIPFGMSTQAGDEDSIHYATVKSPMHYFKGSTLTVLPSPSSSEKAQVLRFVYPSVVHGASDIDNFPSNAEYAVVIGASCSVIMGLMSAQREATPSALSISDLTISATSPSAPSVSAQSVSFSAGAPTYSKPTQTFDITQLQTFLEDNEDSELAQIQLGRLQHELGEYQADIQNELNEFNKETTAYQAQLQIAIQNAQLTSTDDAQKLQLYSAEVQDFQTSVGKEVQQYQSNLTQETQEFGANLQRIQAIFQSLSAQYQMNQAKYQSELQRLSGAKV